MKFKVLLPTARCVRSHNSGLSVGMNINKQGSVTLFTVFPPAAQDQEF
jgi:hypothetical protein